MIESEKKRILVCKQLIEHSIFHLENNTFIDKILSIHHLHLAVEIFLKTIISIKSPKKNLHNINFYELINSFEKIIGEESLKYKSELLELNNTRNFGQHSYITLDIESISSFYYFTKNFLIYYTEKIFNYEFEYISESILIENIKYSKLMELSDKALRENDFYNAFVPSYLVLLSIIYIISEKFERDISLPNTITISGNGSFSLNDNPFFKEIDKKMDFLFEMLILLNLGLNYEDVKFIDKYNNIISFRIGSRTIR